MKIPRRTFLKSFSILGLFPLLSIQKSTAASPVSTKVLRIGSTSFTINVSSSTAGKAYVEYGYAKNKFTSKTNVVPLTKGITSINVEGLKSETSIFYRVRYALGTKTTYSALTQSSLTTTKASSDYVFAVQADPHMDEN